MNDKNKTKAQLISELQQLRRHLNELETAAADQIGNASLLTMAEAAASAIFVFKDSVFLYANPATAKLTGYTVEELIGRNIWTLVHPEFLDRNERVLAFQRGEAVPPRSEFKIITKGGETRWLNADATITEFGGRPAVLTIAYDSTEHKLAQEALKTSEQRYRNILETAQEAIWIIDPTANTTYVNDRLAQMLGYEMDEILGHSVFDFVDPADHQETRNYLERGKRGFKERLDYRFRCKDGSHIWTMLSTTPLFDVAGEFIGGLAMLIDITERRRSEEALRRSEERLRTYIEQANDLIFILDSSGRLTLVNEASCNTTGYTMDELVGRMALDFVVPEQRTAAANALQSILKGGPVEQIEFDILSKDGRRISIEVRGRTLHDGGRISGIFQIARDITERKKTERALKQSEALLHAAIDNLPFELSVRDRNGRVVIQNPYSVLQWGDQIGNRLEQMATDPAAIDLLRGYHQRALADEVVKAEFKIESGDQAGDYYGIVAPVRVDSEVTGVLEVNIDITDRKLAEEALHASEERYRDLVENARDIIYTHDLKGNYISVNRAVEQITGYTREEALKLNFEQSVAPEYIDTARQMIVAKLAGQQETVYDLEIMANDGRRITVEVNTRLVLQDEVPIGVHGIARDVTERKSAERALRESESRLQAILDNCPAMIFEKDLDGRYLQINRQFDRTFDLVPAQVLGRTDDDLFPQELAEGFRATDLRVVEAGHALEFEESAVYADGIHHYIVHKFPLHDVAGDIYAVGGISTEITARKRAEDELRKQKEIFQKIFDHIPVMISFLDEKGHIKLVNREWERVVGWSQNEITANDMDIFAELYPDPEYRQYVMDFVAASTGEFADLRTRARDGRVIETRFANVRLEDGTNIGIGRDITEIKRAEQALRTQSAQLAALHEIGLEISAESDLSRILEVVTHRAAELLGAKHCSTYIRDGGEIGLNLVACVERKFVGLRLAEGEGLAGKALVRGDALIIDDYSSWRGRARAFESEGFGPSIAAPLKWQESAIGSISLSRKRGEQLFTVGDTSLLKQLAAQAAIAIHQATLFDELQESRARLQVLSHRLIDAQEAERKRLARELHDQIGQALTAIQISLQAARSKPDGDTAVIVEDCLAIIDESLELVHDLSFDLRPSLLDDLGLGAALRWYVERATARTELLTCLNVDVFESRFSSEVETACFRIAQESLTNVVRHASARTVSVTLAHKEDCLKLMVQDDGVGFDVHEAMDRRGPNTSLGLQGMRERASALGGIVEIKSNPGTGTEIEAIFPI